MMMILDSSPLIAFYREINNPNVLHKVLNIGYKIKIPVSVYGEITGETSRKLKGDIDQGKLELIDRVNLEEFMKIKNRYPNLKNGEIEVIVWGLNCKSKKTEYYCILDDKLAKKVAQKYEISCMGTKGLIDFLTRKKEITIEEKDDLIKSLEKSTFRM